MDEEVIAAQQRVNIPTTDTFTPAPTTAPEPTDESTVRPVELDELTQFKLHSYFGQQYRPSDVESQNKVQFIFDHVAQQIGTRDYLSVMSRVNDLEAMIGTQHSSNRIQRLYQWVGLDRVRVQTEQAMRLIHV
jgi:hypothetical protein